MTSKGADQGPAQKHEPRNSLRAFWLNRKSWLKYVVGIIACGVLWLVLIILASIDGNSGSSVGYAFAILGCMILAVVFAVLAVMRGWTAWRAHERSRGRLLKSEKAEVSQRAEADDCWKAARYLAGELANDRIPHNLQVWGVVIHPSENVLADLPADYARFYGMNVSYAHSSAVFLGRASFMALGYGLNAMGNSSRRKAAERHAQTQWREIQRVRVIVTDQRLICHREDGRWLSFYYGSATAIYPEPENWNLVIDFHETEPLMIRGPAAPTACAAAIWATHGADGVMGHPGLARLHGI